MHILELVFLLKSKLTMLNTINVSSSVFRWYTIIQVMSSQVLTTLNFHRVALNESVIWHWIDFDSCYFEKLDLNKNLQTLNQDANAYLWSGGSSNINFNNCLINVATARSDLDTFKHFLGEIYINNGACDGVTIWRNNFSSQGVLVFNQNSRGFGHPAYMRWNQKDTNVRPFWSLKEDKYVNFVTESKFGKNTLYAQCNQPSKAQHGQPTKAPLFSVEGAVNGHTTLVDGIVTINRYNVEDSKFESRDIKISFIVPANAPAELTVSASEIGSTGTTTTLFTDESYLNKIKCKRRKLVTSDNTTIWHYQIYIDSETHSGTNRRLSNDIKISMTWIHHPSIGTTNQPIYGIYHQQPDWMEDL